MFGFAYPGQKYPGQAGPDAVVTAVSTLVGPGRLYVEVYSAAGSKLGAGPKVLGAQITAVQNGQVLIALLREIDLAKDLSELLIDLAYSAGTCKRRV